MKRIRNAHPLYPKIKNRGSSPLGLRRPRLIGMDGYPKYPIQLCYLSEEASLKVEEICDELPAEHYTCVYTVQSILQALPTPKLWVSGANCWIPSTKPSTGVLDFSSAVLSCRLSIDEDNQPILISAFSRHAILPFRGGQWFVSNEIQKPNESGQPLNIEQNKHMNHKLIVTSMFEEKVKNLAKKLRIPETRVCSTILSLISNRIHFACKEECFDTDSIIRLVRLIKPGVIKLQNITSANTSDLHTMRAIMVRIILAVDVKTNAYGVTVTLCDKTTSATYQNIRSIASAVNSLAENTI